MTDVYNQSGRDFISPSGKSVISLHTTSLDDDEAKILMASYPRDLISPDSLRTVPADDAGQVALISNLQNEVSGLQTENVKLSTDIEGLNSQIVALTEEVAEFKAVIAEIDPSVMQTAIAAAEAKAKPAQ